MKHFARLWHRGMGVIQESLTEWLTHSALPALLSPGPQGAVRGGPDTPGTSLTPPPAQPSVRGDPRATASGARVLLHSAASCSLPTGQAGPQDPQIFLSTPPLDSERARLLPKHPALLAYFILFYFAAASSSLPRQRSPCPRPRSCRRAGVCPLCSPHPLPCPPPSSLAPPQAPPPCTLAPRPPLLPRPHEVAAPCDPPPSWGVGRGSPAGWAPSSPRALPRARAPASPSAASGSPPPRLPLRLVTSGSLPV